MNDQSNPVLNYELVRLSVWQESTVCAKLQQPQFLSNRFALLEAVALLIGQPHLQVSETQRSVLTTVLSRAGFHWR